MMQMLRKYNRKISWKKTVFIYSPSHPTLAMSSWALAVPYLDMSDTYLSPMSVFQYINWVNHISQQLHKQYVTSQAEWIAESSDVPLIKHFQ